MRLIPVSYTLHQFTLTVVYRRQAHVQTAREREWAWKESATERSGRFNSSVTAVLYACTSLSYVEFRINSITGKWGQILSLILCRTSYSRPHAIIKLSQFEVLHFRIRNKSEKRRSWIRASWYNYENNQHDALHRLIYYSKSVLHVSGDVFAHHQERLTVFTVSSSVHPKCCRLVCRGVPNGTLADSNLGEHYQIL